MGRFPKDGEAGCLANSANGLILAGHVMAYSSDLETTKAAVYVIRMMTLDARINPVDTNEAEDA
jgi:hypothetical protein